MTTTISGSTITFVDGSAWGGDNGTVTPDYNSSNYANSYNVGYLALANTIFNVSGGYYSAGVVAWGLNRTNYSHQYYDNWSPNSLSFVYINTANPVNSYTGSQDFYIFGTLAPGNLNVASGTWRARGQAMNTGLYQYFGNFVLLERVA